VCASILQSLQPKDWQKQNPAIIQAVVSSLLGILSLLTHLKISSFIIPTLEPSQPKDLQRKAIDVFSKLFSVPQIRTLLEVWARRYDNQKFGEFCKMALHNSRCLLRRYNQHQQNLLKSRALRPPSLAPPVKQEEAAILSPSQEVPRTSETSNSEAPQASHIWETKATIGFLLQDEGTRKSQETSQHTTYRQAQAHSHGHVKGSHGVVGGQWPKYQSLGEKVAKMWVLMPPEVRQIIV
jgi:hypothetical protein